MRIPYVAGMLVLALGLVACNTPGSRIKKNQAVFDAFPPEVQQNVRAGKVDVGYTRPMVEIALGNPDRIYTRRTTNGTVQVLAYTSFQTHRDRQRVQADVQVRDTRGQYHTVRDWFWVDVESRNEFDRLRVEMSDDRVTAVEETTR